MNNFTKKDCVEWKHVDNKVSVCSVSLDVQHIKKQASGLRI